jgi:hypothetical protein
MLKRNVGGPGLAVVLFLLLIVVRVTAQSVAGGPLPTDAGWGGGGITGVILSSSGQRFSRRISVRLRSVTQGDRVATTDDKGNFSMKGVPPGEYTLFAWESVPVTAWMNSDFLARYQNRGRQVLVTLGTRMNVQLDQIPDNSNRR